jgi:hypothetical protein
MGKAGARRRALTDAPKNGGHGDYQLAGNQTVPLETTVDYTKELPYQRHTLVHVSFRSGKRATQHGG